MVTEIFMQLMAKKTGLTKPRYTCVFLHKVLLISSLGELGAFEIYLNKKDCVENPYFSHFPIEENQIFG